MYTVVPTYSKSLKIVETNIQTFNNLKVLEMGPSRFKKGDVNATLRLEGLYIYWSM